MKMNKKIIILSIVGCIIIGIILQSFDMSLTIRTIFVTTLIGLIAFIRIAIATYKDNQQR